MGNDMTIEQKKAKIAEVEAKLAPLRKNVEEYDKKEKHEKDVYEKRKKRINEVVKKKYYHIFTSKIDEKKVNNEPIGFYDKQTYNQWWIHETDRLWINQHDKYQNMIELNVMLSYYQVVDDYDPVLLMMKPNDLIVEKLFDYGSPKLFHFVVRYELKGKDIIEVIYKDSYNAFNKQLDEALGYRVVGVIHDINNKNNEEGEPGEKNNETSDEPSAPSIPV